MQCIFNSDLLFFYFLPFLPPPPTHLHSTYRSTTQPPAYLPTTHSSMFLWIVFPPGGRAVHLPTVFCQCNCFYLPPQTSLPGFWAPFYFSHPHYHHLRSTIHHTPPCIKLLQSLPCPTTVRSHLCCFVHCSHGRATTTTHTHTITTHSTTCTPLTFLPATCSPFWRYTFPHRPTLSTTTHLPPHTPFYHHSISPFLHRFYTFLLLPHHHHLLPFSTTVLYHSLYLFVV